MVATVQIFTILFSFVCVSFTSYANVYKCHDRQGDLRFSDRPCDGDSQTYEVNSEIYPLKLDTPSKSFTTKAHQKKKKAQKHKKACPSFSATKLRNLRVKDKLVKGLPKKHLEKRFGRKRKTTSGRSNVERWVYKSDRVTRTLNFKQDCLDSWKETWHGTKSKISKYQE